MPNFEELLLEEMIEEDDFDIFDDEFSFIDALIDEEDEQAALFDSGEEDDDEDYENLEEEVTGDE
ncbi:MAG: hypothetical protein J6Y02_09930 [Pseudobutyrivibrio sp.]|nr:hypothetical protein [Pseudobutyrivibrio sp.]